MNLIFAGFINVHAPLPKGADNGVQAAGSCAGLQVQTAFVAGLGGLAGGR
jgi:hypothetical protein